MRTRSKAVKDPRQTDIFGFLNKSPLAESAMGNNGCTAAEALKPDLHRMREYQEKALEFIRNRGSSIIVIRTNGGKTEVEFACAAEKLQEGKVLLVADTVLLSRQHYSNILQKFSGVLLPGEIMLVTGDAPRSAENYAKARFLVGTPESFVSDLSAGKFSMKEVSLVIFDEVQHMQNHDSYCTVAKAAISAGVERLGFSASPASSVVKLRALFENLGTTHLFHVPDEEVEKYVPSGKQAHIWVLLEPERRHISSKLHSVANETVYEMLRRARYYDMERIIELFGPLEKDFRMPYISELKDAKQYLLSLKDSLRRYSEQSNAVCASLSSIAVLHHLMNMCTLVERVGSREFESYFERHIAPCRSLAAETLAEDEGILEALQISRKLKDHPKLEEVYIILNTEKGSALIFTEMVRHAYSLSREISGWGIPNAVLLGKSQMPAKKQLEVRKRFEAGEFRLLIATSVANEGVHMPNIMTLINYCVPYSIIDYKQRVGRVRDSAGTAYTLVSHGTPEAHLLLVLGAKGKSVENAFSKML
ncbi:MAG: helicase-related protein [Candidatus Micrarchaeia archaeon]